MLCVKNGLHQSTVRFCFVVQIGCVNMANKKLNFSLNFSMHIMPITHSSHCNILYLIFHHQKCPLSFSIPFCWLRFTCQQHSSNNIALCLSLLSLSLLLLALGLLPSSAFPPATIGQHESSMLKVEATVKFSRCSRTAFCVSGKILSYVNAYNLPAEVGWVNKPSQH